MKRVSFSVAKALKKAGYPQGITRDVYIIKEDGMTCIKYPIGVCISSSVTLPQDYIADIPYVMEAWLWLCKKRNFDLSIEKTSVGWGVFPALVETYFPDPEEAIESAINHLVEQNLIK